MGSPERQEKIYDLTNLEEISGGSDEFIRQMVDLFLEQAERTVTGMSNALEKNDTAEIRNLAHQLKPSVDNIKVSELGKEIRIVEDLAENDPGSPNLSAHIQRSVALLEELTAQLKRDFR